jgi:hypothetical protein
VHPYYPSARGLARFPAHGRPSLAEVVASVEAIHAEIQARRGGAGIFLGLHDEGHDRRPAERAAALAPLAAALERFHREQRPEALRGLVEGAG